MGKGIAAGLGGIIGALIIVVVGLNLAPTIIETAVTAAGATGIGSFGGVSALIALIPLGFVILLVYMIFSRVRGG